MQKSPLSSPHVFLLLAFLLPCGCSKEPLPDGMPTLHPVELTFLQDGQPLAEATVKLYPQDADLQRWEAGGVTDEAGKVIMSTQSRYRGVAAGSFKVTVSKIDRDPSTFKGEMNDSRIEEFERAESARKSYDVVEPKYKDSKTTDLELTVVSGKNAQQFDVGKPVRVIKN